MTRTVEKPNSEAREVAESSNVELFIRDITPILERDRDRPLLTESEKLTVHGKNVADEYLGTLLDKYDQDYSAVLEVLRDVEREVRNDTEAPGNYELLQLVRCMRGKLVYRAHLVYALEHYADEFPEKANVYQFLKEKGQPHKQHPSQSVYRAATYISREKAQQADRYGVTEADIEELGSRVEQRTADLASQNQAIVENDVGKSGWERIKSGLRGVGRWFSRNRKEVLHAGAVAAVVVAVSVFGSRLEKPLQYVAEQPKVVQPVEFSGEPEPIEPRTVPLENSSATTNVEAPQTSSPVATQAREQGYSKLGEELPPPVTDSMSDFQIPEKSPSRDAEELYQKGPANEAPEFQEPAERHGGNVTAPSVNAQEAYSSILDKYVSKTEQKAIELAQRLDFIGPESPYEHPSNMCGPLAASVLKDLKVLPADFDVNPSRFWLANPDRLDRLLPNGVFTRNVFESSIDAVEFDWKAGDFVYLQGGDFDHMITVSRVDELGKVYGISNYKNSNGEFVVDEFLLLDPQDAEAGLFKEWPKKNKGRTGTSRVYVWRPSISITMKTDDSNGNTGSASTQG